MLEVLKFVFSSFWIWLGAFLMLEIVGKVMVYAVMAICGRPLPCDCHRHRESPTPPAAP